MPKDQNYKFYFLTDGKDVPFYVGKTICELKKRLSEHKSYWILDSMKINLIEEIKCDKNMSVFWEKYWIHQFHTWGFDLSNTHYLKVKTNRVRTLVKQVYIRKSEYDKFYSFCKKRNITKRIVVEEGLRLIMGKILSEEKIKKSA